MKKKKILFWSLRWCHHDSIFQLFFKTELYLKNIYNIKISGQFVLAITTSVQLLFNVEICILFYLNFIWHQLHQQYKYYKQEEADIFPLPLREEKSAPDISCPRKREQGLHPSTSSQYVKIFTQHFYVCIIFPSNIIIICSCVISIRNQNHIKISYRKLKLSVSRDGNTKHSYTLAEKLSKHHATKTTYNSHGFNAWGFLVSKIAIDWSMLGPISDSAESVIKNDESMGL